MIQNELSTLALEFHKVRPPQSQAINENRVELSFAIQDCIPHRNRSFDGHPVRRSILAVASDSPSHVLISAFRSRNERNVLAASGQLLSVTALPATNPSNYQNDVLAWSLR